MIKRKFGMACLNISQGRYGGYSHKNLNAYDLCGMDSGIDRFKTFNDLTVIGIHEFSRTGFANTISCYDVENDVTLAMTHVNNIPSGCVVGKVFHDGDTIYYEGTKGNATGNHIHLEIGKGKQPSKTKINGVWQLKNLINIEDYFYIDENYTTVKDAKGYVFSHEEESMAIGFKDKYQLINWNGKRVHVYKQTDKQDIGLLSADGAEQWKALQDIGAIDDEHVHCCKVNCNYFVMTNGLDHGQHLGVEQGFNCDNAPKEDGYICVYIDNDNAIHWCRSKDYYLSKNDVKCAFTPFCVNLVDGKDVDDYSYNFGDKRKLSNTQTCLMQCADGKYAFVVFEDKVTPYQTRNFAKEYGCTFNCCLDSGGSSQMIVDGSKIVYTGRKIANVLTLYKVENNDETQENKPQNKPNELESLKAENATLKVENNNLKSELALQRESFIKENDELKERLEIQEAEFNKLSDKHKAFLSEIENAVNKYQ